MSRTRLRLGAAGLGSTAVILFLGVACASDGGQAVGTVVQTTPGGDGMVAAPILGCGDRTDGLLNRASGVLAMTGEFPRRVDRSGDGTFTGTVTVNNSGSTVSGVTSPEADVFVAEPGAIVSTALPKDLIGQPFDLESGASTVFTARGNIRPCAAGAGERLPAGRYDVFAMVVVNREDGSVVVAAGGPWPLEVT